MPINPNDQDPRSTGGGDYTGVYGAGFGGRNLQSGLRKAEEDVRTDDMIERDVEDMSAASGRDDEAEEPAK